VSVPSEAVAEGGRGLQPIASPTLVDAVVESVRASILSGRIAPGERLVEADLARELGTSRGPVREGLTLLEKDGLVISVPRRGKYVPGFDMRSVDEIYSLRKVLEPYAASLLIASMTEAKRSILKESLATLQRAADAGHVALVAERDLAFHDKLYELADQRLVLRTWRELMFGQLRMLLNITTRTHSPLKHTIENHRVILQSVLDQDVERTKAIIVQHIDDAWHRVRTTFEVPPVSIEPDTRSPAK
jgi:DNA-binding GntR family transcriptional regulator